MEEDIIMKNDLDKDQDHKIDQDFLDLIVKNYRHMKRVEIVIYITRDGWLKTYTSSLKRPIHWLNI